MTPAPACLHCGARAQLPRPGDLTWRSADNPHWRRDFPLMCFECVRRHIGGALYDSMSLPYDGPRERDQLVRWTLDEADSYLGSLFGEL